MAEQQVLAIFAFSVTSDEKCNSQPSDDIRRYWIYGLTIDSSEVAYPQLLEFRLKNESNKMDYLY